MIVYFDESYACKEKLLLGAMFLPSKRSRTWLHRSFIRIKESHGYSNRDGILREIKYSMIYNQEKLDIAKATVDIFSKCPDAYFRACVVPYNPEELERIGRQRGIPTKIKQAMVYTNTTVQLFKNTIPDVRGASLMMDDLTRATGDRFDEMLRDKLASGDSAIFNHIGYVDSKDLRTHSVQICDLLLGAVLNEHYPAQNAYKNAFREYVKSKLGLPSLKKSYWSHLSQSESENRHPKYTVRFWHTPYTQPVLSQTTTT